MFVVRHSRLSCLQGIVKRDDDWYSSDSCLKETHDLKKEERAPMSRHEHGERGRTSMDANIILVSECISFDKNHVR